jgi:quercetin dioxygenase-like cupin family protein
MEKSKIQDAQKFDETLFTKVNLYKNRHSSAFLLNFLPGQEMRSHNHPQRELYLHVLEGSGTLFIDKEEIPVEPGDVLFCGKEEQIGFTNGEDEKTSIFCTMTKLPSA